MAPPGAIGLSAMTIANCCGIVFSAASGVSLGRLKASLSSREPQRRSTTIARKLNVSS